VRLRHRPLPAERFGSAPETARAIEAALSDRIASVRLRAAILGGGPRGADVPRELVAAEDIPERIRAEAVAATASNRYPGLPEQLCALIPRSGAALAQALATALGDVGDAACEEGLIQLLDRDSL